LGGGAGPKNVLVEYAGGRKVVRPFRGSRKAKEESKSRLLVMQTVDKETEQLIERIERAVRTAKLQRLSQEGCRRRYYQLNPPGREQEVEVER
jgi:hypothetical protein